MTWPFENDTGAIVKRLAKRSLASESRRNLMVVIAVALAAFLISFAAILSVSVAQIQRSQVADTYEAVFTGVEASDVALDFHDVIIHIFDKENRLFYDLERIWRDGKPVESL